jgi:phospholipid/cholesterol/gamma-HCH transport system substrate-binding protein
VTVARGAAAAALVIGVVVVAVLLLGGGSAHTYHLRFQTAGQLVKDDDVQIGGRRIGSIREIKLADNNEADIKIEVSDDFAPLHEGTKGVIRATSLSGIANRYIALTPGPQSAPELDDGARLGAEATQTPVDLDQLFDAVDPETRKGLQNLIQGSATWYDGVGKQANRGAKYFSPALSTTASLVNELVRDQTAFRNLVTSSSRVVTTLASRRDELASLVSNANETAAAIAAENRSFEQALGLLPGTLRRANTTFVNLRSTLDDLDVLVAASKPATKDLAPFLKQLRPLVKQARPTIADLRKLVRKPGAGNDLTDLLRKAPGLERAARPAFANSITALRKSLPVLSFIRPYTPELVGWFKDFGQTTSNYDANGHFARIQPIFNLFSIGDNAVPVLSPNNRLQGFTTGQFRRCPGTASQNPVDGSAPYRDTDGKLDCSPSQNVEGP